MMLVELLTLPRSRIGAARSWGEVRHLSRPWLDAGPRDIVVAGDLAAYRATLDAAGIKHSARIRILMTPRAFRIDRILLGARLRVRRAGDVGRARGIAQDLGILVVADDPTYGR